MDKLENAIILVLLVFEIYVSISKNLFVKKTEGGRRKAGQEE